MRPKKEQLARVKADGVDVKINKLLSAAYMTISEGYLLYSDAEELLSKYGLKLGESKRLLNRVEKSFQEFFDNFKQLVTDETQRNNYFADLDGFDRHFRKWARIEDEENEVKQ